MKNTTFVAYLSKEDISERIEGSGSREAIEAHLAMLFGTGKNIDFLVAKSNAIQSLTDIAVSSEPGSFEALSAASILYKAFHNIPYNETSMMGIDRDTVDKINAGVRNGKYPEVVAFNTLRGEGQQIVSGLSGDLLGKIKEATRSEEDLIERIDRIGIEMRSEFRTKMRDTEEHQQYLDTLAALQLESTQAYKDLEDKFSAEYKGVNDRQDLSYEERKLERKRIEREYRKKRTTTSKEYNEKFKTVNESMSSKRDEVIRKATADLEAWLKDVQTQKASLQSVVRNAIIGKLLEQSPISEEDAKAWLKDSVIIADNALQRLKRSERSCYNSVDEIKKDMMEFYRLVGGKIGGIKIITKGDKRASANSRTGKISVDSNFNKRVLFHELGHHFEFNNPMALQAATKFRDDRAKGRKTIPLRKLSNLAYNRDEYAFPDNFFDPYVGKFYSSGSTEVVSMGLQQFASESTILHLFENDREHLELVVGMAAQRDPAVLELLNANRVVTKSETSEIDRRSAFEKELKRVATRDAMARYMPSNRMRGEFPYIYPYQKSASVILSQDESYYFQSIQDARNFLYLHLMNLSLKLTPNTVYSDKTLFDILRGSKSVPEWFTVDTKLPKLEVN